MSDSPAPISYIKDEDKTLNNPSISEEKQNFNDDNDYPQNIETTNDYPKNIETTNDNNDTHPKSNSSNPITYKSPFPCCLLFFVIICFIIGSGFFYFFIKENQILYIIGFIILYLLGIIFCFFLKCSSLTIDINLGVIYVKICKIYICKKEAYNIDDISEIDMRQGRHCGLNNGNYNWLYYDIVLILNDGRNIIGSTRSDKNNDSNKVCNTLRNILPQHIKIVNNLPPHIQIENYAYMPQF